jgi:hypothetical protein
MVDRQSGLQAVWETERMRDGQGGRQAVRGRTGDRHSGRQGRQIDWNTGRVRDWQGGRQSV